MPDALFPFVRLWRYIRGGITFVPSVWVVCAILLAIVFRYLEACGLSDWLGEKTDFWIVASPDTARTILSTIIGGVISLTVFSFSMVMVVLGQATSSLSPRLLPQLIRDRSHQTVLGLYLAVIVFSYAALVSGDPDADYVTNPFMVFCCMLMVLVCLAFFVYFIASISRRIQVGEVIRDVHKKATRKMERWQKGIPGWSIRKLPTSVESWFPVQANRSGYVDITIYEELSHLAGKLATRFYLVAPRNSYVQQGSLLFRCERPLTTEEREAVIRMVNLNTERDSELYHLTAMKHIQEVAAKALSPGINDPGTALEAIALLGDLFYRFMHLPVFSAFRAQGQQCGIVFAASQSFGEKLHEVFQGIRVYAREDPTVMIALRDCLLTLQAATSNQEHLAAIQQEMATLREDGEAHLSNSHDRREFLRRITSR